MSNCMDEINETIHFVQQYDCTNFAAGTGYLACLGWWSSLVTLFNFFNPSDYKSLQAVQI